MLTKKTEFEVFIIFVIGILFMFGIYWIDLGAIWLGFEASGMVDIKGTNLFNMDINPNLIYHGGILLVVTCFLLTNLFYIKLRWGRYDDD